MTTKLYKHEGLMLMNWTLNEDMILALAGQFLSNIVSWTWKIQVNQQDSNDIPFTGKHEPNKLTCSQLCDFVAQLVRALHWHRRGHRFKSRLVTLIFQVTWDNCLKIVQQVWGSYLHLISNTELHTTFLSTNWTLMFMFDSSGRFI